ADHSPAAPGAAAGRAGDRGPLRRRCPASAVDAAEQSEYQHEDRGELAAPPSGAIENSQSPAALRRSTASPCNRRPSRRTATPSSPCSSQENVPASQRTTVPRLPLTGPS